MPGISRYWKFAGLILWLGLFFPAGPLFAAQVSVAVPPEITAAGPRVLLGEVAAISVLDPAGAGLAQALAQVDLGPSPAVGQRVVWRRAQLEQRILASRLDLAEAVFSLPDEVAVTVRSQELSQDILRQALERHLADTEPYRSGTFQLVSVNFGSLPTLPPGRVAYRFVPQASSNPTYLSGNFFFAVEGQEAGRVRVTAQVELTVPGLVAARALAKGHVLDEGDLSLTQIPYTLGKGVLVDLSQAVGQTLKGNVSAGDPIRDRNLTKSILVKRGDMVTIIAQQGGLKVTASGQARQDGALGDTISVTNLSSKKNIAGRVIGPNQVEIIF